MWNIVPACAPISFAATMATLASWHDGKTTAAIAEFVERVTNESSRDYVPPAERIAVFDNDGTLWCEKPMPVELAFILKRFREMVAADGSLAERQPWKAASEGDYAWLGGAVAKHYAGDDSIVKVLMGGILEGFAGMTVDAYAVAAHEFLTGQDHPTLGRCFSDCSYLPMVELLHHLTAHGFTTFIVSGGDRDFMRPVTDQVYGIPSERVIGSSNALGYEAGDHGGTIVYKAQPDFFDDGPVKPVRIWSRIGRRPILACGNSNGDIEMLRYAGGPSRPALRLLVLHDDAEREFDYTTGAERSLEAAAAEGWTVVSVKNDWKKVFHDL
jgi:phosphoglycolate phosphatase-like HAD superfamily hydrolase